MRRHAPPQLTGMVLLGLALVLQVLGCSPREPEVPPVKPNGQSPSSETADDGPPDADGRLRALLVGVNGYQKLPPLRFCVNDIESLRAVLVQHAGYLPEDVTLLADGSTVGQPPTQQAIRQALQALRATAQENDTILVAFSGHGLADGEHGYLLPLDADPADLRGSAIAVREVHEALNQSAAAVKFLIVDACHAGGTRDAADSVRQKVDQALFADQEGQICALFSCTKQQESLEQPELDTGFGKKGHGVFSYFLIQALKGEADENENGLVEFAEVTNYLNNKVPPYVAQIWKQKQTPFQISRSTGSVVMARCAASSGLQPAQAAVDPDAQLLTLPGLNGEWWGQEAPWLLPVVRPALVKVGRGVSGPNGTSATPSNGSTAAVLQQTNAAQVYAQSRQAFEQFLQGQPPSQQTQWRAVTAPLSTDSDSSDSFRKYENVLFHAEEPAGLHSAAVCYHRLTQVRKLPWEEVLHRYQVAIQGYEANGGRPAALFALCLSDYAQALSESSRPREAAEHYALARSRVSEASAPLFHVACLCQEANARRKLADWDEVAACYQTAQRVATERLPATHPLVIYLTKQRAWSYMDQWRLREARESFEQTTQLLDAYRREHPDDRSVLLTMNTFHNRHGLAMAERYSGHLQRAIEQYEQLRADMEEELPKWNGDSDQAVLRERLVNTLERLADCRLQMRDAQAADDLRSAKLENQWLTRARTLEDQGSLLCKRAIALAWEGDLESAAEELAEFDRLFKTRRVARLDTLRNIAGLVSRMLGPQGAAAAGELRGLLEKTCDDNAHTKFDRDQLDLFLLAARELVRYQAQDATATLQNAQRLFELVPKNSRGFAHPVSLSYRRQYYDAALLACLALPDLRQVDEGLDYLSYAKTNEYYGQLAGKMALLFYFPKDTDLPGYAIVYDEKRGGQVFPKLTRPSTKGPLPDAIQAYLKQSDLPLEVHWADAVLGLTNQDFPYRLSKPFRFHAERASQPPGGG